MALAIFQDNRAGGAFVGIDACNLRACLNDHALGLTGAAHHLRQLSHPAIHQPNAIKLDMGNEHQCCRCQKRRGASVGGVAAKKLNKTWVVKTAF